MNSITWGEFLSNLAGNGYVIAVVGGTLVAVGISAVNKWSDYKDKRNGIKRTTNEEMGVKKR